MKQTKIKILLAVLILTGILLASCKKEEQVITEEPTQPIISTYTCEVVANKSYPTNKEIYLNNVEQLNNTFTVQTGDTIEVNYDNECTSNGCPYYEIQIVLDTESVYNESCTCNNISYQYVIE